MAPIANRSNASLAPAFTDDDDDDEIPDLIPDWDSDDSECSSTRSQTSTIIIINAAAPVPSDTVSTSGNPFDLSGNHESGDEDDAFSVPDYSSDGENANLCLFSRPGLLLFTAIFNT